VNGSNGTAAFMLGIPLDKAGRATISRMILSTELDFVYNLQYQVPLKDPRIGLSLGAQDVFGTGGAAGTGFPTDEDSSRSIYAVGTYDFGHNVYGSLGIGERRFRGGFANVSAPLGERARATAEYDGFGFNFGLGYSFGHFPGTRRFEANLFLGYVRARNATIGLTVSF
jgi:hypothetical protein